MKAKDIMTTDVVTVTPDATVAEIAALLYERRISGVPVRNGNGRVVGIVSEGDLVRRCETGTDAPRSSWWLRVLGGDSTAREYVKIRATRAADVMTADPVTVQEDTPLAEIARLFETKHIKRVPVVRGRTLVGLVSRANLIQALAAAAPATASTAGSSDGEIRETLLNELESQPWWRGWSTNVIVADGTVQFWGTYESADEKSAARVAAENVKGVKAVEDHRVLRSALIGAE
jgi:CBS domain-containing protein